VVTTNGLAIAALVCGCVGFAFCFVPSILAVVFGYISKSQIDQASGRQAGRGLAVAGIVLGWVGVGLALVLAVLFVIAAAADPGTTVDNDNGVETLRVLVSSTNAG
jgi:predicted metal-binding membrane protein